MVLIGRIQKYVFREVVTGLAVTLGIILLAILLVDMVEQMRTVGSRTDLSLVGALQLTSLKLPNLIKETLPFAVLVGTMLAFSKLNRSSELSAIRAAGVSAWRFLGPAIFASFILGVLTMAVLDPLATDSNARYVTKRDILVNGERPKAQSSQAKSVWLRQGDDIGKTVIHGGRVEENGRALLDVVVLVYENDGVESVFRRRIDAERASLKPGFWQLENVTETAPGLDPSRQDYLALPTTLEPETLLNRYASAQTISFWNLPRFIRDTRQAGLEEDQYLLKLHSLLATPVLLMAMSLIGAVVCLRQRRSGGVSQLIAAGAGAGFILFFVTQFAKGLSASGATPPQAAAWCPPLFALFAVLTVIAYAEDG
ncbi:MAG: LPS export ABC transporter permease LptG [Hirschia sp.]|nr:LPS export ABC transporter permease LptG [Hirschia sp.]MBF18133.1 LPS export ABC transporter permease LptG [Hirschia sp.]